MKPSSLYFIAILSGLCFWTLPITDPDLGWHLTGGAWILAKGALPTHDIINSLNTDWHDYHWLAQIVIYKLYALGGFALLQLALGLLAAWLFKTIVDIVRLSSGEKIPISFLLLLVVLAYLPLASIASVRPQMMALLLVALGLKRLLKAGSASELPYLFALTVLCANLHVYWVFLPLLWLCQRLLPELISTRVSLKYALWGFILLCSAAFVSPYGYHSYLLIWDYLNLSPYLRATVQEFRSPLHKLSGVGYLLLAYLVFFLRVFRSKHLILKPGYVLAALISLALALYQAKFLGIFAILALPYMARFGGLKFKRGIKNLLPLERSLITPLCMGISLILIYRATIEFPRLGQEQKLTTLEESYPISVCADIANSLPPKIPARGHWRVLTHFNYGGWCRFAAFEANADADIRVTADGRTQFVPADLIKDSFDLYGLKSGWQEILARLDPDFVVVKETQPLAQMLPRLSEWKLLPTEQSSKFELFLKVRN